MRRSYYRVHTVAVMQATLTVCHGHLGHGQAVVTGSSFGQSAALLTTRWDPLRMLMRWTCAIGRACA